MATKYELGEAYISIIPSMSGLSRTIEKEFNNAMPNLGSLITSEIGESLKGLSGPLSSIGGKIGSGMLSGVKAAGSGVVNILSGSVKQVGKTFEDTLTTGAKIAGGALAASIATVGAQVVGGGLSRSLGINSAKASLTALGNSAQSVQDIMKTAGNAIDGTGHSMDQAAGVATQLLSAGILQGKELENVLKSTGKLADMSGASFSEIGTIMAQNAATGKVYLTDLNRLTTRGIDIQSALAKNLGVTRAEVNKLASAGKIDFSTFQKSIEGIQFDSDILAEKDVKIGFGNVKSQLSKIGANLWDPILEGLAPIMVKVRKALVTLQDSEMFKQTISAITVLINRSITEIDKLVNKAQEFFKGLDKDDKVKSIADKFNNFKDTISGVKGPIIGLGVAISSSLLSQLPIVGGLLGKVSIGAGLLGGTFLQMNSDSKKMSESIGTLKGSFENLFKSFGGGEEGLMKKLGDSFAPVIDSITKIIDDLSLSGTNKINISGIFENIFGNITDFITKMHEMSGPILEGFRKVWDEIVGSVKLITSNLGGDEEKSIGTWLAEVVGNTLTKLSEILTVVIPVLGSLVSAAVSVITSDFMQGFFNKIIDLGLWLIDHEGVLISLGATLALFSAGKSIYKAFESLGIFINGPIKAAKNWGKMITGSIKGLGAAGSALLSALPGILKGLGAITAIGAAVIGMIHLFKSIKGLEAIQYLMDSLNVVVDFIIETLSKVWNNVIAIGGKIIREIGSLIESVWPPIQSVIEDIVSIMQNQFKFVVDLIIDSMVKITGALGDFILKVSTAISQVVGSVSSLLVVLSEDGRNAGRGAAEAAIGITALGVAMAALGGGTLIGDITSGLGSMWNGLTNFVTGKDSSAAGKIESIGNSLGKFAENIKLLPNDWQAFDTEMSTAGYGLAISFSDAIVKGLQDGRIGVAKEINSLLRELDAKIVEQSYSSSLPYNNKFNSGGSGYYSSNNYNTSNNFNMNVKSDTVIKSLARQAR